MEIAVEAFYRTIQLDLIMLGGPIPVTLAVAEKPQAPVGIPVSMGDPAPEEPDLPGKLGPLKPLMVSLEESKDIVLEGGGNFLICIKRQYPRCLDLGQSKLLLVAIPLPRMVNDGGAESLGDLLGVVGAVVDDDDDFLNPVGHASEAAREVMRLIAGDHGNGNRQFLNHSHDKSLMFKEDGVLYQTNGA